MSAMMDAGYLLERLSKGETIQGLLDFGSESLGNPLVICDTRFRILYMSKEDDLAIPLWQRAKLEGYISDAVLTDMKQENTIQQLQNTDLPVFSTLPNGYRSVRAAIHRRGIFCGFVGMYDYLHPFSEEGNHGLVLLARALSILVADDPDFAPTKESEWESFFFQLLCCETTDQAERVCSRLAPSKIPKAMQLLCIRQSEHSSLPLARLVDIMQEAIPSILLVLHQEHIVILLSKWEPKDPPFPEKVAAIESFCRKHDLILGVTSAFDQLSFIPIAYLQAKACFSHTQTKALFEEIMASEVRRLCLERYPSSFFIHPIFRALDAYDREYHLTYMDTLLSYLRHQGSLRDTADELGIHYNTMKHRLSVIEEMVGVRLRDDDVLQQRLLLSSLFL